MNSCLEFINAGVPILTFPHFGQQPVNATNIIDKCAGLPLIDMTRAQREYDVSEEPLSFLHPLFTSKDLAEKLNELLKNPKYSEAMMVMKTAGVAAGGIDRAEKGIRDYYLNSLVLRKGDKSADHLIEHDYI